MSAGRSGTYAAVDLGASSGRVILGRVGSGELDLTEVHRFPNEPVRLPDGLHWDVIGLYREILSGLRQVGDVTSAGIDSWAIDYGLIDEAGALIGLPYSYRDSRTDRIDATDHYDVTGIQHLPFTTVYQLLAEPADRLRAAKHLLLMPDLLNFWLTGEIGAEHTNASTTALYDARTHQWSEKLCRQLNLPSRLLPPLREPGARIGPTLPGTGLDLPIVAVASHDTASALIAVPATTPHFGYISSGTWSLTGVELPAPVLTAESRDANFSNEVGVDGTVRYLRNVMGLWLLQE
jgi:rhamnulokinase